jgi:hypothetical protein
MTRPVSTTENRRWGRGCLLAGLLLAACADSSPSPTPTAVAVGANASPVTAIPATSTAIPIPATPTIFLLPDARTKLAAVKTVDPDAYATFYAGEVAREQRMLTPRPSNTPQPTPLPITATPQLGLWTDCGHGVHGDPLPANCWQLFINGTLYRVMAGRLEPESETDQGVLWVKRLDQRSQDVPWYLTPQRVGPVSIVAVDGLRFTVATDDPPHPPVSFVFDLATRQWLHPDGTPWPRPTPLPTMPP